MSFHHNPVSDWQCAFCGCTKHNDPRQWRWLNKYQGLLTGLACSDCMTAANDINWCRGKLVAEVLSRP